MPSGAWFILASSIQKSHSAAGTMSFGLREDRRAVLQAEAVDVVAVEMAEHDGVDLQPDRTRRP